ncbi:hypothetical protein [Streptococcus dentiloxodontae]
MRMKKIIVSITLVLSLFVFVGCQTKTNSNKTQNSSSAKKLDKSEIIEKLSKANQSLEELTQTVTASITNGSKNSKQVLKSDAVYASNGEDFDKLHYTQKNYENGQLVLDQEKIFSADKELLYTVTKKDGSRDETYTYNYTINSLKPDVKSLVDVVADMEDDLDLETRSNGYVLTLNNQEVDFQELFSDEFNLNLGDDESSDIDKELEAVIDKKTFYLTSITLKASSKVNDSSLVISIKCDNWNDVDRSLFDIPEEPSSTSDAAA